MNKLKSWFSWQSWVNLAGLSGFTIIILGSFLNLRKIFTTPYSYYFGQYSDFLTASLYLTDFGLLILFLYVIFSYIRKRYWFNNLIKKRNHHFFGVTYETLKQNFLILIILLLIIYTLINYITGADSKSMIIGFFVPLITIVFCFSSRNIRLLAKKHSSILTLVIVGLAVLEVMLALIQFFIQSSLGLPFHLEPVFATYIPNIATIQVENLLIVRPYGTFFHPNILGGFLVMSLFVTFYGYIKASRLTDYIYICSAIVISLGIVLTFSRTALLALIVFMGASIFLVLYKGDSKLSGRALFFIGTGFAMVVCAWLIYWPINLARVPKWEEAAISERLNYNQIGWAMFKDNWLIGVGPGQSLIHMEHYSKRPLEAWEHQPVHNYFLILSSEMGMFGLFAFVTLLFLIVKRHLINYIRLNNTESVILLSGFCALLVLMNGDHYLYTLRSGQVLLWGFLAVAWLPSNPKSEQEFIC